MKKLIALTVFGFALCIGGLSFGADLPDIKADAVLERSAKRDASLLILDVRTPEEFAQGHVPGAKNIPHDQLANRLGEITQDKDKDIVLYCRSGRRAGLAADTLKANGFEKLLHLEGDIQQWTATGKPLEK